MKCPFCSNEDTKVIDSRVTEDKVRRRRECSQCGERFTTHEKPRLELTVEKRDGSKETFDKSKIISGIKKACSKRPVGDEKIREIVDDIEEKIRDEGDQKISSDKIGRIIMDELVDLDKIAYLRFASVYKDFDDPESFEEEVESIEE